MSGSNVAGTTDQRVYYMFAARSGLIPPTRSLTRPSAAEAESWIDALQRVAYARVGGGMFGTDLAVQIVREVGDVPVQPSVPTARLPRSVWQGQGLECLPEILSKCIAALRKSGMFGNTCAHCGSFGRAG